MKRIVATQQLPDGEPLLDEQLLQDVVSSTMVITPDNFRAEDPNCRPEGWWTMRSCRVQMRVLRHPDANIDIAAYVEEVSHTECSTFS